MTSSCGCWSPRNSGAGKRDVAVAVNGMYHSAGGEPSMMMVGPFNKQIASGFTGIATQYRENSGTKRASILGAAG